MSITPSEHVARVAEDEVTFKYTTSNCSIGGVTEYMYLLNGSVKVPFTKSVAHRNGKVLRLKVQL